jgi:hypothetical protein
MRANLLLVSVTSVFHARHCVGLERVSFLDQLGQLSESAPSMLDNPCKSPDCPPDLSVSVSGANASVSTLWLFPRTRVLGAIGVLAPAVLWPRAFVFSAAFFKAGFFFANFFFGLPLFLARFFLTVFFSGFPFFPANPFGFVSFLFSFVLGHTRSLPPAPCVLTKAS